MAPGSFIPRTSKDCGSSSILVHLLDGLLDWEDPTSLVKDYNTTVALHA